MRNTLKKVTGLLAIMTACLCSCGENDKTPNDVNYVHAKSNIQIVSGTIPAPTETATKTAEKRITTTSAENYIVRLSNKTESTTAGSNEQADVQSTTVTTVEAQQNQIATNATAVNAVNTENTSYQTDYNEGDNHIIWQNGYQYYVVQQYDSWSAIANYLDVDVYQLAAANGCTIYDVICAGDELFIPNPYVDYTQGNNYIQKTSYSQEPVYDNQTYSNSNSGTCLSSVTLWSAPDSASWNNIMLSLGTLNGMTLAPGETFNWDYYLGWQTINANYGYQEAPVFVGTEVDYDFGGGVCVTSTALFQAARDAGMNIVERHDHSRSVGYATPGNEASVSYGCMNLIFTNTTGYNVVFYTSCSYGSLTVSCYIA